MNTDELVSQIDRLIGKAQNWRTIAGTFAEVCEFLRNYAGAKSSFLASVKQYDPAKIGDEAYSSQCVVEILQAYRDYVQAGLSEGVSPERKAQLDVVSDFLGMAQILLETSGVHPAAAAVLIGASLEEFLRTWIEAAGLSLGSRKAGLETYSQVLRDAELIKKQDGKDITSWAGIRNHAAHGEWNAVADKTRVLLMLEGVNLFMRKYTK